MTVAADCGMMTLVRIGFILLLTVGTAVLGCGSGDEAVSVAPPEPTPEAAREVMWEASWDQARARAAEEGRPILVDFWVDWCVWCAVMAGEAYRDPTVASLLDERMVPLRLEAEGVDRERVAELGVTDYPTALVLSPEGDELARIEGYRGPQALLAEIEEALEESEPQEND